MKKVLSIAMCIAIMLSLVLETFAATENDISNSNSVSVESLPENIKNLIENYNEIASNTENIDLGENLYDMSVPIEDNKTEVSVFAVPIKYEKSNGDLAFIDTAFEKLSFTKRLLSKYDYKNVANEFEVLFSKNPEDGFQMDETFKMSIATEEPVDSDVEIDLDENKDGRLTYNNVYGDDTYIEYININSGVKENIVLEKNIGKNEFEFNWSSDTHFLELSDDNTFINVVSKDTGSVDYVFSPLYVYDSYTTLKNQENSAESDTIIETTESPFATHSSTLAETTIEETTIEDTTVEDTTIENTAVEDTTVENTTIEDTAVEDTAVENTAIEDTNKLEIISKIFNSAKNFELSSINEFKTKETTDTTAIDTEAETQIFTESTTGIFETQETEENVITPTESTVTVVPETQIIATEDINPDYVNKHNTEDCYYKITDNGNGNYIITAVISKDFLNSKETVYPVTIDPSVTASSSTSNIEDTYVNQASPNTNYGSWTYMCCGYNSGKRWGYVKFKTLPELEYASRISTARINLKFRTGQTTSSEGKAWGITANNWNEGTLTWNTRISGNGNYTATSDHHNCSYYEFYLTDLIKNWYYGDSPNYGIVFTYTNQTYNDYNSVYSSEASSANAPSLKIIYVNVTKTVYYSSNSNANSTYNRKNAGEYAAKHGPIKLDDKNYDTPNYVSTAHSVAGYLGDGEGNNCTNFVSQCLFAGGMSYIGSNRKSTDSWFYKTTLGLYNASYSWGGATSFAKHWGVTPDGEGNQRAYMTVIYPTPYDAIMDWDYIVENFDVGDVIQLSDYSGNMEHSMIIHVSKPENHNIEYAQHTASLSNQSLFYLLERKFENPDVIDSNNDGNIDNLAYKQIIFHKIKKG